MELTGYQLFLLLTLMMWPLGIGGLLVLMSRLEKYVSRRTAETPQEAGIEPTSGASSDPEVKIIFGDTVVGERE